MEPGPTRREAIRAAGSAVVGVSLAGCLGGLDSVSGVGSDAWQSVEPPVEDVGFYGMTFTDESTGWLAVEADGFGNEGGFYRTDDGGDSWTRTKREDASAVAVAREGDRVYGFGDAGTDVYCWYTDDGENWEPIFRDALPIKESFGNAVFFTDQVGVAASRTARRVQRTTDGGDSFETQDLEDCSINDMVAVGDAIVAVGSGDADRTNEGGCLLHSDSRGEPGSWSVTAFTDEAHDFEGGAMTGVYAPGEDERWVVGRGRQIYHTTDGGANWTQVEGVPAEISSFTAVDGHGDHLVATALARGGASGQDGLIYESTDGGETWEVTWPPGDETLVPLHGLAFLAPDRAYAYSNHGQILEFTGR